MSARARRVLMWLVLGLVGCSSPTGTGGPDGSEPTEVHIGKPDSGGSEGLVEVLLPDQGKIDNDLWPVELLPVELLSDLLVLCESEGAFGCECEGPGDCQDGWCVDSPYGKVCTKTCIEECPLGWSCIQTGSASEPVFICLPDHLWLCRPCQATADCIQGIPDNGDKCVSYGDAGSYCGGHCQDDVGCPAGYTCQDSKTAEGGFSKQCVLPAGECQCTAKFIEAGGQTDCLVLNEHGSCPGQRGCEPGGLTLCQGQVPEPESCNLQDDDCDGKIDEGVASEPCDLVNKHGTCPGQTECVGGEQLCQGTQAGPELCNGADDNCDGEIDEAGAAGCLFFYEDQDEDDFGGPGSACLCDANLDFPATSSTDCNDDDPLIYPGAPELCATDYDDNCDGLINDGSPADCTNYYLDQDQDGVGTGVPLCLCGPQNLNNSTLPGDCDDSNPKIHAGAEELCDGLDNDCDELVDELFPDNDIDQIADCVDPDDDNDGVSDTTDCQPFNAAVPSCVNKQCGDDGCGGNCGICPAGSLCEQNKCSCVADCTGKQCGSDGCGGSCGGCPGGWVCQDGLCQCLPNCLNKQCGNDGCGGSCGNCPAGYKCDNGFCLCQPSCINKQCGDDGCGVSCGTCPAGYACVDNQCVCQPSCAGKLCGNDGCGGSCGNCPAGHKCEAGMCICQPSCVNKQCGDDGCGVSCGTCPVGYYCSNNQCVCQPQCAGKQCGSDSCGGSCGTCPAGYQCNASGQCEKSVVNPCGTITFAGQCSGFELSYCHQPGNSNVPCTAPPNCQLFSMDCDLMCWMDGWWGGICACGNKPAICAPDVYCCYCSCY